MNQKFQYIEQFAPDRQQGRSSSSVHDRRKERMNNRQKIHITEQKIYRDLSCVMAQCGGVQEGSQKRKKKVKENKIEASLFCIKMFCIFHSENINVPRNRPRLR